MKRILSLIFAVTALAVVTPDAFAKPARGHGRGHGGGHAGYYSYGGHGGGRSHGGFYQHSGYRQGYRQRGGHGYHRSQALHAFSDLLRH